MTRTKGQPRPAGLGWGPLVAVATAIGGLTATAGSAAPGAARSGLAWRAVATVSGRPAAWSSTRDGVTLVRFDQSLVRLDLHAGSIDPGPGPWRYGNAVVGGELRRLIAAFNGGFRLNSHSGGWESNGRTAIGLSTGLASIVTYQDGTTDIGAWRRGVPSGSPVASVRQNLRLLVNAGAAAPNVDSCIQACWGATLGGRNSIARSALAVTADGMLLWAGAASTTPATIARALIAGGAQRAAELDINPAWVAGYLYRHHGGATAVPIVPGQVGVSGQFLTPYSRDFFAVVKR